MKKVMIVDYGLGNLFSIKQALTAVGADAFCSSNAKDIQACDGILLPGVGAFADAMNRLRQLDLVDAIRDAAVSGRPVLGVCLGLQLLFDRSHEFGIHEGLGLISGEVLKFPDIHNKMALKVPFIGWNELNITVEGKKNMIMENFVDSSKIFFVHSYYVSPKSETNILATCEYEGFKFPTLVGQKNVIGIQGHPEKSATQGLNIYKNWVTNL